MEEEEEAAIGIMAALTVAGLFEEGAEVTVEVVDSGAAQGGEPGPYSCIE